MSRVFPEFQPLPLAEYRAHRQEIHAAVERVLASGVYLMGPEVEAFEAEFAVSLGARFAVGVANGTDALALGLRALGVGPGDAVITVSHTAVATVAAIELTGARPVLVDIDPTSFTMDVSKLSETLERQRPRNLKAIIAVHLYGHPADLPRIVELARRHGVGLVEDCAQSHGATLEGRATGTWGDIGAFSFYPTKNLGALGDGGAVVTNDPAVAGRLRRLRQYGWDQRRRSQEPGVNSRLDEIQAAILRVKCARLATSNEHRRELAARYAAGLAGARVSLPAVRAGVQHAFHQFVIRSARRDALAAFLKSRGIPTAIHYEQAVHEQPAYHDRLAAGVGGLAETESACREVLSLPLHPHLGGDALQHVIEQMQHWLP